MIRPLADPVANFQHSKAVGAAKAARELRDRFQGEFPGIEVYLSGIVMMTLAVADSIHLLVTYLHLLGLGRNRTEALVEALRVNFSAITLTSLTTAIGFLSLKFSDAPPFRHLGNVVAIGVVAAWMFSIVTLPAFMAILPSRARASTTTKPGLLNWLPDFIIRHRRCTLWGSVAVVVVLAAFIPRIELNDQWVKYFGKSIEFRGDTDFAMDA